MHIGIDTSVWSAVLRCGTADKADPFVAAFRKHLDQADRRPDADAVFARAAAHHRWLIEQHLGCERFATRLAELRKACRRQ